MLSLQKYLQTNHYSNAHSYAKLELQIIPSKLKTTQTPQQLRLPVIWMKRPLQRKKMHEMYIQKRKQVIRLDAE